MDKEMPDGHDKTVTIIVNTRPKTVEKNSDVSFELAIEFAYGSTPPTGENMSFTVTYERAEGNKSGSLTADNSIKAKEGMIFHVYATDRS